MKGVGGVAIYIMNDMKYKLRDDLAINIDGELESLLVEINTRPNNLIISEVYRIFGFSDITFVDRYKTILSQINDTNMDCIIATDQNVEFLKWTLTRIQLNYSGKLGYRL